MCGLHKTQLFRQTTHKRQTVRTAVQELRPTISTTGILLIESEDQFDQLRVECNH